MKKIGLLAAGLMLISYNVQAIPPPPPLPPAIGSLSAKLKVLLRVSDLTKCEGFFCDQSTATCELDVKIPVVPASSYDEGSYGPQVQSAEGQYLDCKKTVGGYEHSVGLQIYATLNAETGTLKIVNDMRSGKRTDRNDLDAGNAGRNVTVVSASLPSLKVKNSLMAQIYKSSPGKSKSAVSNTSMDVSADLDFASLTVGAP